MLSEDFSIFIGPTGHGKTTFLHRLAFEMKDKLGSRIAFISPEYDEHEEAYFMNRRYEMARYLPVFKKSSEPNNMKVIESIYELCSSDKIDFVFVDDIDAFGNSIFAAIERLPAKKAVTCASFPFIDENYEYTIGSFKNYSLSVEYNGKDTRSNAWRFQVDGEEWNSFISSSIRDQKINSIIR